MDTTHTLSFFTKYRWTSAAVTALLCVAMVEGVHAQSNQPNKHDKWLREHLPVAQQDELIPVIVSVKAGANANVTTGLQRRGFQHKRDFSVVSAFSADLPAKAILSLGDDSDVLSVSFDSPITASSVTSSVSGSAQNSPYSLRGTLGVAGTSLTGNGVTVAVIDSGIYPAPDFGNRIVKFLDFTRGGVSVAPMDPYGHGTHVAGIIGGSTAEVPGMAPAVKLIGLRVLNGLGAGATSDVIDAIQWATDNRAAYKIDIINLSLGHIILEPAATDPLVQAVEGAVRAGIVVMVSAGNVGINPATGLPGYAGILSPGNAPSAITVGAERTNDTTRRSDDLVAEYSSRGPTWYDAYSKPDVVAPGHHVLSTADSSSFLYITYPSVRGPVLSGGREYLYLSGTSMSTAVVSGSVALMIEAARTKFPSYQTYGGSVTGTPTPNAVKAMLMNTAFKLGDASGTEYDVLTQGAGALNTAGGITLAQSLDGRISVGNNWLVGGITESSVNDGQTIAWANRLVWGDQVILGDTLYSNRTAWAKSTVWGDATNWGYGNILIKEIVWDSQPLWGHQTVWSSQIVLANVKQIVWGNSKQIVWGNLDVLAESKQIVWGNAKQIVWGNLDVLAESKQIVWGNVLLTALDGSSDGASSAK